MGKVWDQVFDIAKDEEFDGFDCIVIANRFIEEMKLRAPGKYKWWIGRTGFVVVKKAKKEVKI